MIARTNQRNILAKLGLVIAMFPIFGLDQMDQSGYEKLGLTSMTFLIRGFWVLISTIFLFLTWYHNKLLIKKKSIYKESLLFNISLKLYFLGTIISILLNTPTDIPTLIRFSEQYITITLGIYSIKLLLKVNNQQEALYNILLKTNVITFLVGVSIVIIIGLFKTNLAFSDVERGIRFGGVVLHPNTLSLGACISFISILYLQKNKLWKKYSSIIIAICILILGLTISSSGLITFIFILIIILIRKLNFSIKLTTIFMLLILIISFFIDEDIVPSESKLPGTWQDRLSIYVFSIKSLQYNPFFGVGAFKGLKDFFEKSSIFTYWIPSHAHNFLISIVLSRGILGSFPFFMILYICVKKFIIQMPSKTIKPFFALQLIPISILFHGLFESSIGEPIKPFCQVVFFSSIFLISMRKINYQNTLTHEKRENKN